MIRCTTVTLRPATVDDRRDIYRWLVDSDVTPSMIGPPEFPEIAAPSWEEYSADYALHFFDGSRPERGRSFIIEVDGEAVGHVSYDGLAPDRPIAELDIWMRSLACCGHGYGADALMALMHHLHAQVAVELFIIRPSQRNPQAIRACTKAGFRPSPLTPAELLLRDGPGEFVDTVTLECRSGP